MRDVALNASVFVNCPFDDAYLPCFEAILFAVTMSGYQVRCALEEDDAGDVRFDKLCELIAESDRTIHDLSRTAAGADGLPRFNMPFELGLMMGARRYGRGPAASETCGDHGGRAVRDAAVSVGSRRQ